jgi:rhodanese-related sulfurtransferase
MKKTVIILSALASMFFMSCNSSSSEAVKTESIAKTDLSNFISPKTEVTAEEALALSKEGALLIDVRELDELAEISYDVSNIKHIPLGELESRLSEVPKDKQVVLVCRSGGRSGKAQVLLQTNGFKNIANMEGGMNAWSEKGLPTHTGGEKKACCDNPNSKDCNPDGTCKKPSDKK